MRLNPETIRTILLEAEKLNIDDRVNFNEFVTRVNLPEDEVKYTIILLKEGGFINAYTPGYDDGTHVVLVQRLTYEGHQFVESIRDDTVWGKTVETSKKVGVSTVQALFQIATGVVTSIITQQLNS